MALHQNVSIARRFLQSVRIDTDLNTDRLEGFICTPSSAEVLRTMARHVAENEQGAFTWTGPYGSGKSSLAVAFGALLNGNVKLRKQAEAIFPKTVTQDIRDALSLNKQAWQIVPVVGRREHPALVIGEAIEAAQLDSLPHFPKGGWTESSLLAWLKEATEASNKKYGGIILFIDEMGKFLESAAQDGTDIYLFQQLAEIAARRKGRLILVGVLHQAFEEYARRLSRNIRDEWRKIQGRFIDLAINTAGEEQIDLISRAITNKSKRREKSTSYIEVAKLLHPHRLEEAERLASMLQLCWPLHPVTTCLLGPISRRRFGQNQRSIFGFLNSAEAFGFQDFLRKSSSKDTYNPSLLWDYLRANLEPSILASPDGHRWTLATDALERCEAEGGDNLHLKLLKTIAVIDLFKERSGLSPSLGLLKTCFPKFSQVEIETALTHLQKQSLIIFKKFLDAYAIYAGSDFNIDQAIDKELAQTAQINFETLAELANIQPMLAKRHYHQTGAMRWYEVKLTAVSELPESGKDCQLAKGIAGQFILAIATEGESSKQVQQRCQRVIDATNGLDIIVGTTERTSNLFPLASELEAIRRVSDNSPALAGDAVARQEIGNRTTEIQINLEVELQQAFNQALWLRKGEQAHQYDAMALNELTSKLADDRFSKGPKVLNELLNRQKPSVSAVAARNTLLKLMVEQQRKQRLGIEGFPAEGGLYDSLLEATMLHRQTSRASNNFHFAMPTAKEDPKNLRPIWEAAMDYLTERKDRTVAVSEIYQLWSTPPYGVKEGLLPVFMVAFILAQSRQVSVYRSNIFRTDFDDVDLDYLSQDPSNIQLRWLEISKETRDLLYKMADIVRTLDPKNPLQDAEPIDVARGLVAIYDSLPSFTKMTRQLSSGTRRIRDIFKQAKDPNRLLFDDLPNAIVGEGALSSTQKIAKIASGVKDSLQELGEAYPSMLKRITDQMLWELEVPNQSDSALLELRDRAKNIHSLSNDTTFGGNLALQAFTSRLAQLPGKGVFESIASLAVSKQPQEWTDLDCDKAIINIADMSQKFMRLEQFAHVAGRADKRRAITVTLGLEGQRNPLQETFTVSDTEKSEIDKLNRNLEKAISAQNSSEKIVLASLMELSAKYIKTSPRSKKKKSRK